MDTSLLPFPLPVLHTHTLTYDAQLHSERLCMQTTLGDMNPRIQTGAPVCPLGVLLIIARAVLQGAVCLMACERRPIARSLEVAELQGTRA